MQILTEELPSPTLTCQQIIEQDIKNYQHNLNAVEIILTGEIGNDSYIYQSPQITITGKGFDEIYRMLISNNFYVSYSTNSIVDGLGKIAIYFQQKAAEKSIDISNFDIVAMTDYSKLSINIGDENWREWSIFISNPLVQLAKITSISYAEARETLKISMYTNDHPDLFPFIMENFNDFSRNIVIARVNTTDKLIQFYGLASTMYQDNYYWNMKERVKNQRKISHYTNIIKFDICHLKPVSHIPIDLIKKIT